MYQATSMGVIPGESQEIIRKTIDNLNIAGLQVVRSFDLRVARAAHTGCTCPHHGTEQCSCQMVVLLVYDQGDSPATLVVHGYDGQVQISVVDTLDQLPSGELVDSIVKVILPKTKTASNENNITLGDGLHAC